MTARQLGEADQDLYKNFPLVVSERWQQEVAETVFDMINQETDKIEQKRKQKPRIDDMEENCKCHCVTNVLQGVVFVASGISCIGHQIEGYTFWRKKLLNKIISKYFLTQKTMVQAG